MGLREFQKLGTQILTDTPSQAIGNRQLTVPSKAEGVKAESNLERAGQGSRAAPPKTGWA